MGLLDIFNGIFPSSKKGIYVVSDLHGDWNSLKNVLKKLKSGKKVIILGDAIDRGQYGIQILQNIQFQQSKHRNVIEYLPGNHDDFLYSILYKGIIAYEGTGDISIFKTIVINGCNNYLANPVAKSNGMLSTYISLKKLLQDYPLYVYNLGVWLGSQPLLRIEKANGKKIALGHAAFDMDIYNSNYTLRDYYDNKINNPYMSEKARLCLWYRDTSRENVRDAINYLKLPSKSEATDMVVGHTPYAGYVSIYGTNGTRTAFCVDCAEHSETSPQWMGYYDPRYDQPRIVFKVSDFPGPVDPSFKQAAMNYIAYKIGQINSRKVFPDSNSIKGNTEFNVR